MKRRTGKKTRVVAIMLVKIDNSMVQINSLGHFQKTLWYIFWGYLIPLDLVLDLHHVPSTAISLSLSSSHVYISKYELMGLVP